MGLERSFSECLCKEGLGEWPASCTGSYRKIPQICTMVPALNYIRRLGRLQAIGLPTFPRGSNGGNFDIEPDLPKGAGFVSGPTAKLLAANSSRSEAMAYEAAIAVRCLPKDRDLELDCADACQ